MSVPENIVDECGQNECNTLNHYRLRRYDSKVGRCSSMGSPMLRYHHGYNNALDACIAVWSIWPEHPRPLLGPLRSDRSIFIEMALLSLVIATFLQDNFTWLHLSVVADRFTWMRNIWCRNCSGQVYSAHREFSSDMDNIPLDWKCFEHSWCVACMRTENDYAITHELCKKKAGVTDWERRDRMLANLTNRGASQTRIGLLFDSDFGVSSASETDLSLLAD